MTVLIGARDPQRGEEAAAALRAVGGDAHAVILDVTDPATVQEAAKQVEEHFGHLDVLINNAGITGSGQISPEDAYDQVPSTVDLDMVRAVFETNVFGVIAVTNAMLPLLRRSPAPRVVNVRRPRLCRHGQQQSQGVPSGRAGRRGPGAPCHARRGRPDRRVLQRRRPAAMVMDHSDGP